MDTVNLVLALLGTFALATIVFACLAARHWYRAEVAQKELARLVAQQTRAAGYDTGLVEKPA